MTGRANTQDFSDYMDSIGQGDPNIMAIGKTWNAEKYPGALRQLRAQQQHESPSAAIACTNADIDIIGARVNGRNRPNGVDDRISYTDRAIKRSLASDVLGLVFIVFLLTVWRST